MGDVRGDKRSDDSDKRSDDGKKPESDDWEEQVDGYTKVERARYWETDGFDVEGFMNKSRRPPYNGLIPYYFDGPIPSSESRDDCPTEIVLHAKFGIHWYNMLHGKNLQLSCIQKYNYLDRCVNCSTYITCLAMDPFCVSPQVFQMGIVEEGFGIGVKTIYCFIARPKFGPQEKPHLEPSDQEEQPEKYNYGERVLPDRPSENTLHDKSRYYLLKKSDVRKYDWIRLYLELAFLKANTKLKNPDLAKLDIGRVAVETRQETVEPLKAVNSVFYIKYKYHPNKGRSRKGLHSLKPPRDRIAIIKRIINKPTGDLTLMFETSYSKTLL